MSSITYDIAYLQESLEELESYLLSADLYGQVHANAPSNEPPFASLTLGNVLLAREELGAYSLDTDRASVFGDLDHRLEGLRSYWRAAWEEKARREYPARVRQWARFLEEFRRDPENQVDRYPYEARQRVIIQLLGDEVPGVVEENRERLFVLDELLKRDFIEGEFVWDKAMREGFPKEVYWYLWGQLRG
jgi:hypothetical protein